MYRFGPAPTDQRAGIKPISFVLQDAASELTRFVTLNIRPEDLTRTDPARVAVHQTLGRSATGWVDNFGEGLPTINISGNTGWRNAQGTGLDGAEAFDALNQLITREYHEAKQIAINTGMDPAAVRLIFVDVLDDFAYPVVPTVFSLRRSKSRPLLFQYTIALQAISKDIESIEVLAPDFGNPANGVIALNYTVSQLEGYEEHIKGWLDIALEGVDGVIGGVSDSIAGFVTTTNGVLGTVLEVMRDTRNLSTGIGNRLIGIASGLASVGLNIFRVVNSISGIGDDIKSKIGQVAAAYNEALCILSNSLRPRRVYEQYTGLYGASNCSSTTGGKPASPYANLNVFSLMSPEKNLINLSGAALSGINTLGQMDPVLAPLPMNEIGRMTSMITSGVTST